MRLPEFMFATGIECSYPTIERGRWRIDQLEETGHYRHWRQDLELVRELGLKYLRYGPPLYSVFAAPGKYDWSFTDLVFPRMKELGIVPIADLCHFGVPDWLGNFQNPDLPHYFAEYASAFAQRYPWIQLYTPVNEMYVAARESALNGTWNEQLRSEKGFVTAVCSLAKASALAILAIRQVKPDAIFITSESTEFCQSCCPDEKPTRTADFENQRRFIALDLLYAHPLRPDMREYLLENGLSRADYDWFMNNDVTGRAILGLDYYEWNEHLIDEEGRILRLGELFGWYVIAQQYYDRYEKTLMHTETNRANAHDAPAWLWRQWHNVQLFMKDGIPVVGFTWYSLHDQIDWDKGLAHAYGNVHPVGLYDLNRYPRLTAQAYKHLISMFKHEVAAPEIEMQEPAQLDAPRRASLR